MFKSHHIVFYSRDFKDKISEGGFGEVYKGWIIKSKGETDKGVKVAIKASHGKREIEERRQWEVSSHIATFFFSHKHTSLQH